MEDKAQQQHRATVGQETIYESNESEEILNSVPISLLQNRPEESEIDRPAINVADAFQTFHTLQYGERRMYPFQPVTNEARKLESPWEKYHRLKSELDELRNDLNSFEAQQDQQKDSVWGLLQVKTTELIQSSDSLASHRGWEFTSGFKQEGKYPDEANSLSSKVLEEMIEKVKKLTLSEKEGEEIILVFQQYLKRNYSQKFLELEAKVARIESSLGVNLASDAVEPMIPFTARVQKLEHRMSLLDLSQIENIKAKLVTIKPEFESLIHEKNADGSKLTEIFQKIKGVIDGFEAMQSFVENLPLVVARLKTLESVHWNATSFNNRLSQFEVDLKSISSDLNSNDVVLKELKGNLAENFSLFNQKVVEIEKLLTSK